MKFLLAFAALLLAMTSVAAEASQSCAGMDNAAAAMANAPGGPDCHDTADHVGAGAVFGCSFAAHCALLCGVTPPAGPETVHAAQFVALKFFASAEQFAGSQQKPEAPPPRPVVL